MKRFNRRYSTETKKRRKDQKEMSRASVTDNPGYYLCLEGEQGRRTMNTEEMWSTTFQSKGRGKPTSDTEPRCATNYPRIATGVLKMVPRRISSKQPEN